MATPFFLPRLVQKSSVKAVRGEADVAAGDFYKRLHHQMHMNQSEFLQRDFV